MTNPVKSFYATKKPHISVRLLFFAPPLGLEPSPEFPLLVWVYLYQIFVRNRILRLSYKYKSFLSKVVNFFCKNYYTTILTIRYCAFGVFYFRFFFQCRFCLALAKRKLFYNFGFVRSACANCKCAYACVSASSLKCSFSMFKKVEFLASASFIKASNDNT